MRAARLKMKYDLARWRNCDSTKASYIKSNIVSVAGYKRLLIRHNWKMLKVHKRRVVSTSKKIFFDSFICNFFRLARTVVEQWFEFPKQHFAVVYFNWQSKNKLTYCITSWSTVRWVIGFKYTWNYAYQSSSRRRNKAAHTYCADLTTYTKKTNTRFLWDYCNCNFQNTFSLIR